MQQQDDKEQVKASNDKARRMVRANKLDQPIFGLLGGLVFLFIGIVAIKFLRHPQLSFSDYFLFFTSFDNVYLMSEGAKVISLSLFTLLAPFYFFLNKNSYYATRGVLIVAMIAAAFILLYKYIL